MPAVFLTGATGCVGHYLIDALSPDYDLYLLVRDPARLRFDPAARGNIRVIRGDMERTQEQADVLKKVDFCIHAATSWGGKSAARVNIERAHALFSLAAQAGVKRTIYFSTASILGRGNRPLQEARRYGTDYIRTKYDCYADLSSIPRAERIITVFPTLIFGGDARHPYSHLSRSLPMLRRHAGWLGRLRSDLQFHFIHARDIARLVRRLLETDNPKREYVLGNQPLTLGQFTREAAGFFGHRINWQIPLPVKAAMVLAPLLGGEVSPWDRFQLEYGSFLYETINCPMFGLPDDLFTIRDILADWERNALEVKRP